MIVTQHVVEDRFHELADGDDDAFDRMADAALAFQRRCNPVYGRFSPHRYLPVRAFKEAVVAAFDPDEAEAVFLSSGTGHREQRSRHYVRRLEIYRRSVVTNFSARLGEGPFTVIAHVSAGPVPRGQSSLVAMIDTLIDAVGTAGSAWLEEDPDALERALDGRAASNAPILVFGTAFALLDFVEKTARRLPEDSVVMETGGMKTSRLALSRARIHERLARGFGLDRSRIQSEYGMCELLSQFYSMPDGLFYGPPWVRFQIVDPMRPDRALSDGETGALAVTDLANVYSASCILTEDAARAHGSGFELLGRLKGAELRGCNFLMESLA